MNTEKGNTRILAGLALNAKANDITPEAYEAAKKMIIDTIGCAIAGYKAEGIPEVIEQLLDWGGKEESTVMIYGKKLPAPLAAYANSAMSHAFDYDHSHQPSGLGHILPSVLPVSLAAAEMTKCSGKDFLAAVIMGFEVTARLGAAFKNAEAKGGYFSMGFLPAGVVGGFGASASACRIFGFDIQQTVNALGINYAQAAGNRQALFDKTLTKRLQPAFTTRSALWAAMLAKRGITGPPNALEGSSGLFSIYKNAEPCLAEELTEKRNFYEIERDTVKSHPCCCFPQAHLACELGQTHNFKAEDIDLIQVHMNSGPSLTGGKFFIGENPQANAQFSSAYATALGVLRGRMGLKEILSEQVISDTEVAELAARVTMAPIEELPKPAEPYKNPIPWTGYGHNYQGVKVKTKDGKVYTCFKPLREIIGPETTMAMDNIRNKFHECTEFSGLYSAEESDKIINEIMELDKNENIAPLIEILSVDVSL
jgi:2-methylcitrate dehydratase PrpD